MTLVNCHALRDDVDIIVEMIGGSEGVALDLARVAVVRKAFRNSQ